MWTCQHVARSPGSAVAAVGLIAVVPVLASMAAAADPRADDAQQKRIAELIEVLRATRIDQNNPWAAAIKELVEIGKPAVPALIAELDRTTEDRPLRSLGFTLRAIGDPRAVPALIRAIPRSLIPPASDYGLTASDAAVLVFMRKHDLQSDDSRPQFGFGRPFREITGALRSITGQRFNEDELNFVSLRGGKEERKLQRWLYAQLAARWAGWWEQNWPQLVDDPAYARVGLTPLGPRPKAVFKEQPFPTGERVKVSTGFSNMMLGPPQSLEHYRTFEDLDTGRNLQWPDELPDPKKARDEAVRAWALREGYDLRGIEYRPPGSDESFYALQAIGLRFWQVENERFNTIEQELREGNAPELRRPVGDLLMDFDPETKRYFPENQATFLFVTQEGATGILQITGQITELIRPEDIGRPIQGRATRGFFRGVQFQYKLIYEEPDADPAAP